jgi:hypothetical protein
MERSDQPTQAKVSHGNWIVRRRFMMVIIAFCMAVVTWTLLSGRDDKVAEAALTMSFTVIATTVGSYVFGAAWEKGK